MHAGNRAGTVGNTYAGRSVLISEGLAVSSSSQYLRVETSLAHHGVQGLRWWNDLKSRQQATQRRYESAS
jgi:hypothetical protein